MHKPAQLLLHNFTSVFLQLHSDITFLYTKLISNNTFEQSKVYNKNPYTHLYISFILIVQQHSKNAFNNTKKQLNKLPCTLEYFLKY